ncbi:TetR/AcrR family transcriptional regulator [Acetobacterium bakii]|uniref:TetR family transcriptional regulator n=1 Tax=Acetobacterium bakii TaxID=52689 RepID=A0A0L6TZD0_9FIRM|nr:TetR/AcrR family transcriptional regulator [Acetobacterium bakii]KNZ41608.1 TetR family transcriptional regulator [Acetobacterium bakii]
MGEKAEYKSAIRSRRLIREAFLELIQEKDVEKITVTDIITRADINRGTFYAHYQDIRDLMEQIGNEIIAKVMGFLDEFHYRHFLQDPLPLLSKIADWLEEDLEYYRILMNASKSEAFLVKLKEIFIRQMETDSDIPEHIKKTPEFSIHLHFMSGGIINLYQVWLRGDLKCSLQDISLEIKHILSIYSGLSAEKSENPCDSILQ